MPRKRPEALSLRAGGEPLSRPTRCVVRSLIAYTPPPPPPWLTQPWTPRQDGRVGSRWGEVCILAGEVTLTTVCARWAWVMGRKGVMSEQARCDDASDVEGSVYVGVVKTRFW